MDEYVSQEIRREVLYFIGFRKGPLQPLSLNGATDIVNCDIRYNAMKVINNNVWDELWPIQEAMDEIYGK